MSWYEEITKKVNLTEDDSSALKKHDMWQELVNKEASVEEFIQQMVDPDIDNEFCYYNIEDWDKLIRRAKEDPTDSEQMAFKFRLLRASLVCLGIDPETAGINNKPEMNITEEMMNDPQWLAEHPEEAQMFRDMEALMSDGLEDANEQYKTEVVQPEYIQKQEAPVIFDFEPSNKENNSVADPLIESGYIHTDPEGNTHVYIDPNPQFFAQLKDNINILGCDRYGNKLSPHDPLYRQQLENKKASEEEIQNECFRIQDELDEQQRIDEENEKRHRDFIDFCDEMIFMDEEDKINGDY